MILRSKLTYLFMIIVTIGILNLLPVFESGNVLAFKPHNRKIAPHARLLPGKIVTRLPAAHVGVWGGGSKFLFHHGVFYRKGSSGFIVVNAPIGAVISGLPIGYSTIVIDGDIYYCFNGVYYQKASTGYIVVNSPISSPSEIASGSQVTVTAELLNVRSGPGMQFAAIGQARQGDILTVHGNSPGWHYVKISGGKFGWVSETFTAPAIPSAVG